MFMWCSNRMLDLIENKSVKLNGIRDCYNFVCNTLIDTLTTLSTMTIDVSFSGVQKYY